MRRLLAACLLLVLTCGAIAAQKSTTTHKKSGTHKKAATQKKDVGHKIAVKCPAKLKSIKDCPNTGCGPALDPHLNEQKNIPSDDQAAVPKTLADLQALPDPVPDFKIGDTREKIKALGEG